jgi:hypothetical protein
MQLMHLELAVTRAGEVVQRIFRTFFGSSWVCRQTNLVPLLPQEQLAGPARYRVSSSTLAVENATASTGALLSIREWED